MKNTDTEKLVTLLREKYGDGSFNRKAVKETALSNGLEMNAVRKFWREEKFRVGRGAYSVAQKSIPTPKPSKPVSETLATVNQSASTELEDDMVPLKDKLYVKWGFHEEISKIIGSGKFYPIYVTGLSGNGKTFMVEQICAELKRKLVRVNITIETDEDDLLGGFRLVNDCTKWFDGPVVRAMKSGSVLLLDEVDLSSTKIMCLQPVLEGKGVLLKKINQYVRPRPGFTIIATANTKGQGCESGKFVGTNILNEAFLERFPITFEQKYPGRKSELKILDKVFGLNEVDDNGFGEKLVDWADSTRKTFESGGFSDMITTRRLVHIVNAYCILGTGDRRRAIELCLSRFDDHTKTCFLELYEKIDPVVLPVQDSQSDPLAGYIAEAKSETTDITSIFGTQI